MLSRLAETKTKPQRVSPFKFEVLEELLIDF